MADEKCVKNFKVGSCDFPQFFMAGQPLWSKDSSLLKFRDHTHLDIPHSVGVLWTKDQPVAETADT